ncbi:MAG: hypothetical protein KKB50_16860 [Planctomycetes bacterium]|nr:hypothetical protein [Planctomycetota bacterium]
MHARVERLPQPQPDCRRLLQVLRRERPDRIPMLELAVHPKVVSALLDEPVPTGVDQRASRDAAVRQNVRLHHRLGYDVVRSSAVAPFTVQRLHAEDGPAQAHAAREWADEHGGPIGTMDDFERFAWPTAGDIDFGPIETAAAALPDGMALVGFTGGVLEFAMDLIGMQRFMLATRRDPALVGAVLQRVGETIRAVFEVYCQMDAVCAIWLGDDLGHKHGLLVSPKVLEANVFPWYRRFADLAHQHGRPFLLHTCGDTRSVMSTIVEQTAIDAKHSFEDAIQPVEQFYDQWNERIGVLGGVDVHLLAVGEESAIRARTLGILAHTADHGGYAAGSGNSIPDYIPPDSYLAMIEALAEFNGS